MEFSSFVASKGFQEVIQSNAWNQVDWTDAACNVRLVKVPFAATPDIDPATIPPAPEFAPIATGIPTGVIDGSNRIICKFPDPAGGYDFVSLAGSYPLTAYGFRVEAADGSFLGCGVIPQQPLTAPGQHVIVGTVQLRSVTQYFALPGAE